MKYQEFLNTVMNAETDDEYVDAMVGICSFAS